MRHAARVVELTGPKHVAICSCNWLGREWSDPKRARLEANDHMFAEIRQEQGDRPLEPPVNPKK